MKFCSHCGKELLDEAVICPSCGTALAKSEVPTASSDTEKKYSVRNIVLEAKKKWSVKNIILFAAAVVAVVGIVVGGLLMYHNIRVAKVKEELAGNTYRFFEMTSYSYTDKAFKFDDEAVLEYSYYYSSIDSGNTYTRDYKIRFEDGMVFLDASVDSYEIQYDRYGNIESLCDVSTGDIYD